MTDENELLPCPFCGYDASFDARVFVDEVPLTVYSVHCNECWARTPSRFDTREAAEKEWNTRADLAPTTEAIDAAVEALCSTQSGLPRHVSWEQITPNNCDHYDGDARDSHGNMCRYCTREITEEMVSMPRKSFEVIRKALALLQKRGV